jgi:hypothetical protein
VKLLPLELFVSSPPRNSDYTHGLDYTLIGFEWRTLYHHGFLPYIVTERPSRGPVCNGDPVMVLLR